MPYITIAKIVFVTIPPGLSGLYVMEDDGSNVKKLLNEVVSRPTWSPDGRHIAFSRDVSNIPKRQQYNVFLIDPNGNNEQRLTFHAADVDNSALEGGCTWASDSSRLAFHSNRSGTFEIHVIDIFTREIRQLTRVGWATDLSWSPDGRHIAYEHSPPFRRDLKRTIYVVNADGKRPQALMPHDDKSRYDPKWSPDSKSVLYNEYHQQEIPWNIIGEVVIQKYGTKNQQFLTLPQGWSIGSACWMNHGRQVLFVAKVLDDPKPNFDIYRYDLASEEITKLTNSPLNETRPHWISDDVFSVNPIEKVTTLWGATKK